MGKYLTLWETDMSRFPEDPKEQLELLTRLNNMVQEDLKNGPTKDFGMFLGGDSGYAVDEGTEEEVAMANMKYCPLVNSTVQQVLSVDQIQKIIEKFQSS